MADEIRQARALILPSFAEGLPVVIMEAMALKKSVISTFVAGIPELVKTGEHGWLVPASDIEALVKAVKTCLETPERELTRMGEAGSERAFSRHLVDVQVVTLANLFAAACAGHDKAETDAEN